MRIKKKTYPDGSFYPEVEYPFGSLLFRINSYNDLWFLKQIKDTLDHNYIKDTHLIIPCLLDAQADKRFAPNSSNNLKLICEEINRMNWTKVEIFHPHNQEVVEAKIDRVKIIDNSEFLKKVLISIRNDFYSYEEKKDDGWINPMGERLNNNLILLSTDAGGFKPLIKLADKLCWSGETFSASKSRKYVDGESKLIQQIDRQDFNGKDILIIDDLCIYGGTAIGLAKLLRERNVGKLYIAFSHITVSEPNPELWEVYDEVFTTNSKGLRYSYFDKKLSNIGGMSTPKNLHVLDLFGEGDIYE